MEHLTDKEKNLLTRALRIAFEDGSIYGDDTDDKVVAEEDELRDSIERKLGLSRP